MVVYPLERAVFISQNHKGVMIYDEKILEKGKSQFYINILKVKGVNGII